MQYMWRITKYNPKHRNESGVYSFDEWTSYSDVGKVFNGKELTITEYERYEKAYIESVLCLMECNQINKLQITGLEIYEDVNGLINNLVNGIMLTIDEIKVVIKYILREYIWCKLVFDENFYVHFGYDFIMYIGSSVSCEDALNHILTNKMFIESCESPYLDSE